jgi:hypothetical protein
MSYTVAAYMRDGFKLFAQKSEGGTGVTWVPSRDEATRFEYELARQEARIAAEEQRSSIMTAYVLDGMGLMVSMQHFAQPSDTRLTEVELGHLRKPFIQEKAPRDPAVKARELMAEYLDAMLLLSEADRQKKYGTHGLRLILTAIRSRINEVLGEE